MARKEKTSGWARYLQSILLITGFSLGFSVYIPQASAAVIYTYSSQDEDTLIPGASWLTGVSPDLTFSVERPFSTYTGTAGSNDAYVAQSSQSASLPVGNEMDFGINYKRPIDDGAMVNFGIAYRVDADNVAGIKDKAAMLRYLRAF